jgi:hypothetical protein
VSGTNPPAAAGQTDVRGSIRGTVYEDTDGDGLCHGTDEPVLPGIPVEFRMEGSQESLFLESGDDGTYGLVAVGMGTWHVSAAPPTGYAVTSSKTLSVSLTESEKLVLNVDFCVSEAGAIQVLLPESGATTGGFSVFTALVMIGMLFVLLGIGFRWRSTHQS